MFFYTSFLSFAHLWYDTVHRATKREFEFSIQTGLGWLQLQEKLSQGESSGDSVSVLDGSDDFSQEAWFHLLYTCVLGIRSGFYWSTSKYFEDYFQKPCCGFDKQCYPFHRSERLMPVKWWGSGKSEVSWGTRSLWQPLGGAPLFWSVPREAKYVGNYEEAKYCVQWLPQALISCLKMDSPSPSEVTWLFHFPAPPV